MLASCVGPSAASQAAKPPVSVRTSEKPLATSFSETSAVSWPSPFSS
jgi:hypothetical protein